MKRIFAILLIGISILFTVALIIATNKKQEVKAETKPQIIIEQAQVQPVEVPQPHIPQEMFERDMFDNTWSRYEFLLLVANTYAEGGNASDDEQRAIASVHLNRVLDDEYPNTLEGVIYQDGQYATVTNGALKKYIAIYEGADVSEEEFEDYERCLENVEYVIANGVTVPRNCVYQAEFSQGAGEYRYFEDTNTYICYKGAKQ